MRSALALLLLSPAALARPADPPQFLLIAPEPLLPAAKAYLDARRPALPAAAESLDAILASTPGVDAPERLKRHLYTRWRDSDRALRYVLLVGDADLMPVRYMVLDRAQPQAFNYAFYPSDLYYADLAKPDGGFEDWNARRGSSPETEFHAHYFGEVRGEYNKSDPINFDAMDYRPEIAVGRWPVATPDEVGAAAAKSIAYERWVLSPGHTPAVGLVASGGWIENRPAMDALAARFATPWAVRKLYFADAARNDQTPAPDEAGVLNLLNTGASLILHSGHGTDTSWEGAISTGSLAKLTAPDHPAILFSAGCSTARLATLPPYEAYTDTAGQDHKGTNGGQLFTAPPPPPAPYQRGPHNPTGLGEALIRSSPGAAAYIGCNTGSQPCGMTLLEGFAAAAAGPAPGRLGDCWRSALLHYHDAQALATLQPTESWYPASIFFQGMKFMLFGDPSLPMPGGKSPGPGSANPGPP